MAFLMAGAVQWADNLQLVGGNSIQVNQCDPVSIGSPRSSANGTSTDGLSCGLSFYNALYLGIATGTG